MDPFSISVAAVGIAGTAISGMSKLRETITSIKDAPEELDQMRLQLDNIRRPLDTLQSLVLNPDVNTSEASKQALARTGMADAVNHCGAACDDFNKNLQNWTKHSTKDKLSLRDKISMGVWNKERVRTCRSRVETCQQTVHLAMSSTQL